MSKTNPNQDHYKTAGRSQTEGPDRLNTDETAEKRDLARAENRVRDENRKKHPAIMKSKRK